MDNLFSSAIFIQLWFKVKPGLVITMDDFSASLSVNSFYKLSDKNIEQFKFSFAENLFM